MSRVGLRLKALGILLRPPPPGAGVEGSLGRGEAATPREAASQECCHFGRPGQRGEFGYHPAPLSRSPQAFVPAMADLIQKKLQGEVEKYQQLQKDLSKSMSGRQKLEAQLTENNIMKEELALLDGSNVVFKLLGPVLVKQELGEARATVGKRLDYITAEM